VRRAIRYDVDKVIGDLALVAERKEQPILYQRAANVSANLISPVVGFLNLESAFGNQLLVLEKAEHRALQLVTASVCHSADHV
jgi:hypothetical protein